MMNRRPFHAAAAAALGFFSGLAAATLGPPQSCAGQPGVGGCAPYAQIIFQDDSVAGGQSLFEYDDPPVIDFNHSGDMGAVRGAVNLARGELQTYARGTSDGNVSTNLGATMSSIGVDLYTLQSSVPSTLGGDLFNIGVTMSTHGVGAIDVPFYVVAAYLHLGFNSGVVAYNGGQPDAAAVIQSVSHVPVFQEFGVPLTVFANLTVRAGQPFDLNWSLRANVSESSYLSFVDLFSNGAHLSFQLPDGARVTSMSGFDSLTAVPEPAAASLLLLGLAGLGLLGRARRLRGVGMAALLAAGSAHAGLTGNTVTAELLDLAGAGGVSVPFAASAVVGPGPEFTAVWNYTPLNQVWEVTLDVHDSGFTVTFNDVGGGNNHDLGGFTFLGLRLAGLDPGGVITGVTVPSSDGAAVQSIGFSDHGVTVQWNGFQFRDGNGAPITGGSSVFGIQASAVPEPGSVALWLTGLTVMLLRGRQKRRGTQS